MLFSLPNSAYAALQNQLDRWNWAAVPLKLSNGTARIEQSHRSGWIWTAQRCQGIINTVGVRCLAAPSACAWIPCRQWLWCRRREQFGRRWHQPAVGQTAFLASPGYQIGNRRSWSFTCTGTPRFPISPWLPLLSKGTEAIRQSIMYNNLRKLKRA